MKTLIGSVDDNSLHAVIAKTLRTVMMTPKVKALELAKTKPIVYNEFN